MLAASVCLNVVILDAVVNVASFTLRDEQESAGRVTFSAQNWGRHKGLRRMAATGPTPGGTGGADAIATIKGSFTEAGVRC